MGSISPLDRVTQPGYNRVDLMGKVVVNVCTKE